jgi:hypothetical protein
VEYRGKPLRLDLALLGLQFVPGDNFRL